MLIRVLAYQITLKDKDIVILLVAVSFLTSDGDLEGDSQVLAIFLISCNSDSHKSAIKNFKVRKSRFLPMAISL